MSDQYFKDKPQVKSEEIIITSYLRGQEKKWISDRGVFSRKEVDFGTKTMLDAFVWPEVEGSLLDIGCGYGVVGITLAGETRQKVYLTDVNERALELARKNADKYKVPNVKVIQSDLYKELESQTFAAILSNPPIRAGKKTVHAIIEGAYNQLKAGGEMWVVIQKKQGAPSAKEKMETVYDEVELVKKNKGYYILKGKKY